MLQVFQMFNERKLWHKMSTGPGELTVHIHRDHLQAGQGLLSPMIESFLTQIETALSEEIGSNGCEKHLEGSRKMFELRAGVEPLSLPST
jgi:hypothetical protein